MCRIRLRVVWTQTGDLAHAQDPFLRVSARKKAPPIPHLSSRWETQHSGHIRSGVGGLGASFCLAACDLVAIKLDKVDVFEIERWEATVACDVADDTSDERKDHPGTFDQQEGMKLLFWHVFDMKHADIVHFEHEERLFAFLVPRGDVEFGRHLILMLCRALLGVQIDGDLNVRLKLAACAEL